MKTMINTKCSQRGISLIEAMIAMAVIGIGLLAILQLQVGLQNSGGHAKARAEALELATEQADELKTYIELGQYNAVVANTGTGVWADAAQDGDNPIAGVNASYTREWIVRDDTAASPVTNLKELIVRVSWVDAQGEAQQVMVNSMVTFSDPNKTARMWIRENHPESVEESPLKSPFISGVEGPDGSTDGQTVTGTETDDQGTADDITDDVVIKTYDGGNVEVIKTIDDVQTVVLTAFGGKINRIQGYLHYIGADFVTDRNPADGVPDDSNAMALHVLAGSPSYCEFPIATGNIERAAYVCYVPADCSETTGGENGCPAASSSLRDLNGGWYGRVGIFGTNEPICTVDTVLGTVDSGGKPTPARNYVSLRLESGTGDGVCSGDGTGYVWSNDDPPIITNYCVDGIKYDVANSEGINTPYACHNFLINPDLNTCLESAVGAGANIISSEIVRALIGDAANTVEPLNQGACMIMITGPIYHAGRGLSEINPRITLSSVPEGSGCIVTAIDAPRKNASYVCLVPRGARGSVSFSATPLGEQAIVDDAGCGALTNVTCAPGDYDFGFTAPETGDVLRGPGIEFVEEIIEIIP